MNCQFLPPLPFWKKFTDQVGMLLLAMLRCTSWGRYCVTARKNRKEKYLPGIANGSIRLQAFGVTEPGSGTDTSSLRTTAIRSGDRYIVNGQKIWTSRAEHSDLMLLLCRTTPINQVKKRSDGLIDSPG